MKTATQNLEDDHVYILQLTDVMLIMAERKAPNAADIETVISLIKNFADGFHHAKEENHLFPSMIEKGFSKEQGPVAVMLHDHDEGRNYVKGMNEGLQLYRSGNSDALTSIYDNMKGYCQLLQNHISKENNVLFRMADKAFSEIEQEHLLLEFEKIANNETYKTSIPEYLKAINNLKALYKN